MSRRKEERAAKVGKRPRKRVVLVLVEGRSEQELLMPVISGLFERIDENILVYFPVIEKNGEYMGGDITSSTGVTRDNIELRIYNRFLKQLFDREKLYPKDVSEVIQIVDMDGAYIDDEQIDVDPAVQRFHYGPDRITVGRQEQVEMVIERNRRKRENLQYLLEKQEIKLQTKQVKYSVYYFASNLDHFFHGDANMEPGKKMWAARALNSSYDYLDGGVERFVKDVCADPRTARGKTLEESWEWIRERGSNSLQAGSNINLLLERLTAEAEQAQSL